MSLTTEDRQAIFDLAARYNQAIDSADIDSWIACWTADGHFDPPGRAVFDGPDGLRQFAEGHIAQFPNTRHWNANHVIAGDGDSATMSCYLNFFGVKGGPKLLAAGTYQDTLRKVDGKWLFATRKVMIDRAPED